METSKSACSFFVIDDHPVVVYGLKEIILSHANWRFAGSSESLESAKPCIVQTDPDIIILDLTFPDGLGLDFMSWLRRSRPDIKIIIYSIHPHTIHGCRCLASGADAFVCKSEDVTTFLRTVELVLNNQRNINGTVVSSIKQDPHTNIEMLSPREAEVLLLLGQGRTNREIAKILSRSTKTIESHRYRMAQKLGISNGPELNHFAMQYHTIDSTSQTRQEYRS